MIEAMENYARIYVDKAIPENEEYVVYEKTLQIMHRQHALWEYFCGEIEARQNQGVNTNGIIHLIGTVFPNEVEKKDSKSEIEKLAAQVKEQIRLLIARGMKEEAESVIQQVKKIIPEDLQL